MSAMTNAERSKKWAQAHPERMRAHNIRKNHKMKDDFFRMYGPDCNCCGESNRGFLTLDHKDGNERQRTQDFEYRRAVREGYRPDLWAVLCYNCNMGRARNKGTCPHNIMVL